MYQALSLGASPFIPAIIPLYWIYWPLVKVFSFFFFLTLRSKWGSEANSEMKIHGKVIIGEWQEMWARDREVRQKKEGSNTAQSLIIITIIRCVWSIVLLWTWGCNYTSPSLHPRGWRVSAQHVLSWVSVHRAINSPNPSFYYALLCLGGTFGSLPNESRQRQLKILEIMLIGIQGFPW